MPIDSTNYGRELRNIFAEIKSLRAEVADMQSALLSVQEQYGYAVVELFNRSGEFAKEILEIKFQLQNSAEISQQKFENLKTQSEQISNLMNENLNSVQERFSQLEKTLADNLDKINSRYNFSEQQNEITYKNLAAQENLLRLIAANQMLDEVENNFRDTKTPPETISVIQKFDKNNSEPITSDGMYKRGMDYFEGKNGYNKNKTYAFKYFLEAANLGHIQAMEQVADCYKYGWGVFQDKYEYRRWHTKYLDASW